MARIPSASEPAPHSWDIEHWPQNVYPHTPNRGRYVVRAHNDELMRFGALSRIGREIVVIGAPYSKWLASQAARIPGYDIAPNRESQSAA